MILLALALIQAAPAAPQQSPAIVAIGKRLKAWRGSFAVKDGKISCKITKSSGDRAVDAIGCQTMEICFAPIVPKMNALPDGMAKADQQRALTKMIDAQQACLVDKRRALIADLADERQGS